MEKTFLFVGVICLMFVSSAGAAVPIAPTGLKAVSSNANTVKLTWLDNSKNETKFKIFRKKDAGPFTVIYTTPGGNIKSYSDATAASNTTTRSYSYYIKACNASGCSTQTKTAAVPFRPTTLTATAASKSKVNLKWTDKSANETAFDIERNDGECTALTGTWTKIKTVAAGAQNAADTSVLGGKKYAYRVRAKAQSAAPVAIGFSGYSNCSSVTMPGSAGGSVQLPETGQKTCYNEAGDVIACTGTGQDGELRMGVAWPNPRFVSGTGTEADCMIDNLTGLMWPKNGNLAGGTKTWQEGLDYANSLNYCGHTDWRLPNRKELFSLVNREEPDSAAWLNTEGFNNVQSSFYWSSSTDVSDTYYAWSVYMGSGSVFSYYKVNSSYVWLVRGGQPGESTIDLPQTGQTTCYADDGTPRNCAGTGEDGELRKGVSWPTPRFVSGAGTEADCMTDKLTGLMWPKNGNLAGGTQTWQGALNYVRNNTTNLCGHSDWRLPNINELESLVNLEEPDPAAWLNLSGQGFNNVQSDVYWSSSTYAFNTDGAWFVDMWYGGVGYDYKDSVYYVWPVRAGQ